MQFVKLSFLFDYFKVIFTEKLFKFAIYILLLKLFSWKNSKNQLFLKLISHKIREIEFCYFFQIYFHVKIRQIELCHATLLEFEFTEKFVKLKFAFATFFKVVFTEKLLKSSYATFHEIEFCNFFKVVLTEKKTCFHSQCIFSSIFLMPDNIWSRIHSHQVY